MLEKEEAKYLRCIFDNTLEKDRQFKEYLKKYNNNFTLIKDSNDDYYYINYISNNNIKKLRKYSMEMINGEHDEKIKKKYEWLINKIENFK